MAESSNAGKMGVLGVLIGALIVIVVGGGLLYATGFLDPRPTSITVQQPAASKPAEPDRSRADDRRGDWRDDRRGDRDGRGDDRPDRR